MTVQIMTTFPTLYKLSTKGKPVSWSVSVVPKEGSSAFIILVTTGYVNGKKQTFPTEITSGKNLGKSNETSIQYQAMLEAEALWVATLKKGYVEDLDLYVGRKTPMLAQDYRKHARKMSYPAYVQPKLEGIRCFARKVDPSRVVFLSRESNPFTTLGYIAPYIRTMLQVGEELDGELYSHQGCVFEDLVSYVKNPELVRERESHVKFHMYDFPAHGVVGLEQRLEEMEKRFALLPDVSPVELVPTNQVNSEEEMLEYFHAFVEEGYEGIIIRRLGSVYEYDKRSYSLMKYKEFIDEEFEILDVKPGRGKFKDKAVFVCRTKGVIEGCPETFDVVAKGGAEVCTRFLSERHSLIGKWLTVQYQRLTKYGVPYLPVGLVVRDYE